MRVVVIRGSLEYFINGTANAQSTNFMSPMTPTISLWREQCHHTQCKLIQIYP